MLRPSRDRILHGAGMSPGDNVESCTNKEFSGAYVPSYRNVGGIVIPVTVCCQNLYQATNKGTVRIKKLCEPFWFQKMRHEKSRLM